jgi:HK97 gp10 family phage protein
MASAGRRIWRWNRSALERLLYGREGAVYKDLERRGRRGVQAARQLVPVSADGSHGRPAGYLRDSIDYEIGRGPDGDLYVDIVAPAKTPDGRPYGKFVELGTDAHTITAHGDYPLRNRKTGQVFGREVHHPGTDPQPFLRPAIQAMRD